MPAMIFESDEIRSKTFTIERKGYSKGEVDAFLRQVADNVSHLLETERSLRSQIARGEAGGAPPESDVAAPAPPPPPGADFAAPVPAPPASDFTAVGEEVTAVLTAARESADSMRTAAEAEAAKTRREAKAFAAEHRGAAETAVAELTSAAELEASSLRRDAGQDRSEAERLLSEARENATELRAGAEKEATQAISEAEERAVGIVAAAKLRGGTEYDDAIALAKQKLEEARGAEQEILYSLTAAHSDVGAAIARLDQATADETEPAEPEGDDESTEDDADADDAADAPAAALPSFGQSAEPKSELERSSRQVTGGLADSLRETAGVSGPVGALFGLSESEDDDGDDEGDATPSEPDELDLRNQPVPKRPGEFDDPLADLVKQAVGKAVERADEGKDDEDS